MKEREGHEIILSEGCKVLCYCMTCRRYIFESNRHDNIDLLQADMIAREHWDSFSLHHNIVIFDVPNLLVRTINNVGKMKEDISND